MGRYTEEHRRKIRSSYINERLPLTQAAERHDVGYRTATSWKKAAEEAGDNWDTARAALRISQGGAEAVANEVLEDYILLHKATVDEVKNSKELTAMQRVEALTKLADSFAKTMKAFQLAHPEARILGMAMDVMIWMKDFINTQFPEHQAAFAEVLQPFGEHVVKKVRSEMG